MIRSLISLIRPHQWVKNVFVLMPIFFSGRIMDVWCLYEGLITFFAFSFAASSIYCLNDLRDIEDDRRHPVKRLRPLASGKVTKPQALALMAGLAATGLLLSYFLLAQSNVKVTALIAFYLCLNVAYCYKLKQYSIIDVFIIALGFVLRLMAGGQACNIWLSPWIVLMTFLLALFLAFAKRRDDVVLYQEKQILSRRNVVGYNMPFLNQTLGLIGAITIVCYIMYSVSPDVIARFNSSYVYITSIFVLAAVLRYLQVTIVNAASGSPTKVLLRDRFLQLCIIGWILTFTIILYL